MALLHSHISKQGCTFDTKVRSVEAAGGGMAIVFDSVGEPLLRMMSTSDADINIPSVRSLLRPCHSSPLVLTCMSLYTDFYQPRNRRGLDGIIQTNSIYPDFGSVC